MSKAERLVVIRELIQTKTITTQEELLKILQSQGIELTQATLSRDLKQLRAARVPNSLQEMVYVLSDDIVNNNPQSSIHTPLQGFLSMKISLNLAIIKTLPAYSHTIADTLDKLDLDEILGTVAGNDTILVVLQENTNKNLFIQNLKKGLPELQKIL